MKKAVVLLLICSLFCIGVPAVSYAQDLSISQKIEKIYDDILSNETVAKCIVSVKSGWASFKKWFNNLPGIRHYNNSIYSGKNWKKTMNDMGNEYNPHLKPNSAGAQMLKDGKKQWDNL